MSYLRDQDDLRNHSHDDVLANKEHELTLSTAAIFGIFFGQVVLCAIFFGFGYSLGGHRSTGQLPSDKESSSASSNPDFTNFKPAAGQPVGTRSAAASSPAAQTPAVDKEPASTPPVTTVAVTPLDSKPTAKITPVPIVRLPPPSDETPRPTVAPQQGLMVQVAAISITHPNDATMLQNALRAKGYAVSQHPGADNFIHLLLGPFADRAAAEAMRQRLRADGYIAYIK